MVANPAILSTLLGAVLLLPSMAMAHGRGHGRHAPPPRPVVVAAAHQHFVGCAHMPSRPPAGMPVRGGNYQLQNVSSYVPGRYEQQWVPEVCRTERRGRYVHNVCRQGYYESVWVPGQQVVSQEWVWVPAPRYVAPRPVVMRPGFTVNVRL